MPGSRKHEIDKIFPESIKASEKIADEFNMQIVVACSENIDESIFDEYGNFKFRVIKNQSYNLFKHSAFGIIKSGTSTMEAAIIGLPFSVVYATSGITYLIGKTLVRVKNIAMPNIIAGKEVVKEFIQNDLSAAGLFGYIKELLEKPGTIKKMKYELAAVRNTLGSKSASELAAKIICA
jgi:lipid-A-disaccharide synthase